VQFREDGGVVLARGALARTDFDGVVFDADDDAYVTGHVDQFADEALGIMGLFEVVANGARFAVEIEVLNFADLGWRFRRRVGSGAGSGIGSGSGRGP
jgi:hypothetical protein